MDANFYLSNAKFFTDELIDEDTYFENLIAQLRKDHIFEAIKELSNMSSIFSGFITSQIIVCESEIDCGERQRQSDLLRLQIADLIRQFENASQPSDCM